MDRDLGSNLGLARVRIRGSDANIMQMLIEK